MAPATLFAAPVVPPFTAPPVGHVLGCGPARRLVASPGPAMPARRGCTPQSLQHDTLPRTSMCRLLTTAPARSAFSRSSPHGGVQARRCWRAPSPARRGYPSSRSPPRSLSKCLSAAAPRASASSSSRRARRRRPSSSSTSSMPSGASAASASTTSAIRHSTSCSPSSMASSAGPRCVATALCLHVCERLPHSARPAVALAASCRCACRGCASSLSGLVGLLPLQSLPCPPLCFALMREKPRSLLFHSFCLRRPLFCKLPPRPAVRAPGRHT